MGTEPLLLPGIARATRTDPGEGLWQKPGLLCRRSRSTPVDDGPGKLQEVVDIGKIRRQPNRNAECPLLPISNDVEKLFIGHALFLAKDRGQFLARQAQSNLAHAWITKTAAAHREPTLVGVLLDRIAIQDHAGGITEIEGDGSAALLCGDRTIDAHHWLSVAMAQFKQLF